LYHFYNEGRKFEYKVLGRSGTNNRPERKTLSFEQAIRDVFEHQPPNTDPFEPLMKWGLILLKAVKRATREELMLLKLGMSKNADNLVKSVGLYDALGTEADFFFETDAVMACRHNGTVAFFTLDLTTYDDGREFPRENHSRLLPKHFTERDYRKNLRVKNVAAIIAENLVKQIFQLT
jgi:hypothetical protein